MQPSRREVDPQLLPPRTGPVLGCHLPVYEQSPGGETEECREVSPPPQYSSNPQLYQPVPPPSQNVNSDHLPPYQAGSNFPKHGYEAELEALSRQLVQETQLANGHLESDTQQPMIDENAPGAAAITSQSTSISVQEQIKKINENIAIQNSSYQEAVLSPKPEKKPVQATTPKLSKKSSQNNKKNSDNEKKPFKMFSPLPRRKNKPVEPIELEEEVSRKPAVPSEAVKFILEQKIENLIKETANKKKRREDFETSIKDYPGDQKEKLRCIFAQKESDFLRLKRSKINKDMFTKIKTIGIGSFGEVTLVQKQDTGTLYAMKTLRKAEVWKRNQTAHVKAERDILSEADNEWVVKLHFSFQDKGNLYFVMDYIPGGDMMSLLIKQGRFPEWAACFYIAELVCAVESVHKLGFIHRDIKPDNILIDEKGHLKLTDFGLCTGFHWTHDSARYKTALGQPHDRQASIDFDESLAKQNTCNCGDRSNHQKPLDRRRAHQRCLAHSLVGKLVVFKQ